MGKIDEILVGLTERTAEGRSKWRTSANPNGFVSAVGDIAVIISRTAQRGMFDSDAIRLEILNDEGTAVEAIETADLFGVTRRGRTASLAQTQRLRQLFTLAQRSALDVDATLDELARNLESIR